ncbi:glycosyltransferase [Acerihabitans sp. KWT182]|uniref:Glycosyltransferase n=1 Tax=Acerihabitans sp. KWT182 TaxID=3157919 RepID=A0AAU7Q5U2_9GAMM
MFNKEINIFSVIVSYNPELSNLIKIIQALKLQHVNTIVVDNGTLNVEDKLRLEEISYVLKLDSNLGIAKAQNVGIEMAKSFSADYIIFFDQDSQIEEDFVKGLTFDFFNIRDKGVKLAAIGPVFTDSRYGFTIKFCILVNLGFVPNSNLKIIKNLLRLALLFLQE